MAERPPSDFDFDFGAGSESADDPPRANDGENGENGKDRSEGDGGGNGDGVARRGSGRARGRSHGDGAERRTTPTFDPTIPSTKEKGKTGRRFGLSRKAEPDPEHEARENGSRRSRGSASGEGSSRSAGRDRPQLIRDEEERPPLDLDPEPRPALDPDGPPTDNGLSASDDELAAFDQAFQSRGEPQPEPTREPTPGPEPDLELEDFDIDPLPEPEPKPEPTREGSSGAPELADDDLFDSAFEEPAPRRGARDIDSAPSRRGGTEGRDGNGNGRAGDLVRPGEEHGAGDLGLRLGRPPRSGGSVGPAAPRSLGGVQLPDMSGIGERLRALREQIAPERESGAVTPGVGGGFGGFSVGGTKIKLPFGWGDGGGRKKGRIKKARLLIILFGLGILAMVSTFFGMMMAVSSDLPDLENRTEFQASENSVVYDVTGAKLGTLTNNNNRILVESGDIAANMKQATVAIEDRRFYEHSGVDFKGMARAAFADLIPGGSVQGASTITQQFVKNALEAQDSRTVFQKFRESALAYHLEQQWDKDKILTQYLNTIYFGEGAYGIEAAASTYFGYNHPDCGTDGHPKCASLLLPEESAMLAGIISSPSAFSPTANPEAALSRRNLVLDNEAREGFMTEGDAAIAKQASLPSSEEIQRPAEDSVSPYFTSWLRQVLVDRYGPGRAFGGGLRVKTTLDLDLQEASEGIVSNTLGGVIPTSSLVVIDNETGGIRAMVGGLDYAEHPFNLATNGHRQPGSSFKPFTLITALENGHSAGDVYNSAKIELPVPNSAGNEVFQVNNYDDIYYGTSSITSCTVHSDNSCFAQMGYDIYNNPDNDKSIQRSLNAIVETSHKMGITTDVTGGKKANPALILGGLIDGVTPLEMAHAYSTIANDGVKISGTLSSTPGGPVPIEEIKDKDGKTIKGGVDKVQKQRVIPEGVAQTAKSILAQVVSSGTGKRAQVGESQFGKTGTTDNNGDAWFCGAITEVTACVWVGHADSTEPMETEFGGLPVDGGTFPAVIWAQVINSYLRIQAEHEAGEASEAGDDETGSSYVAPAVPSTGSSDGGDTSGGDAGGGGGGGGDANPAPAPAPAPSSGGGSGGVGAGL